VYLLTTIIIIEIYFRRHNHGSVLFKIIKIYHQYSSIVIILIINVVLESYRVPWTTDQLCIYWVDVCIIMHNFKGVEQNANPTLQYLNAQTSSAAKYNVKVMCYAIQSVKNVGNISRRFYLVSILFTWMDTSIRNFPP